MDAPIGLCAQTKEKIKEVTNPIFYMSLFAFVVHYATDQAMLAYTNSTDADTARQQIRANYPNANRLEDVSTLTIKDVCSYMKSFQDQLQLFETK